MIYGEIEDGLLFLQIVAVASSCEQDHFNTGALTNLKNSVCHVSKVLNEMTDIRFDPCVY